MTADTVVNAKIISAKYSAGPNFERNLDDDRREQRNEYRSRSCRRRRSRWRTWRAPVPARPFFAIKLPSSAVAMEADSPGVLSRIVVVEPPYMAP